MYNDTYSNDSSSYPLHLDPYNTFHYMSLDPLSYEINNNDIFFFNNNVQNSGPIHLIEQEPATFRDYSNNCSTIKKIPEEKVIGNNKNKYFPFKKGKGLETILRKIGLIINPIKSNNINRINSIKFYRINYKFNTIIYENGKRRKKKRKEEPDLIRKKIKNKIHRALLKVINYKLKKAGSKLKFAYFPNSFIVNMNKEINKYALKLTFEELIKNTEIYEIKNKKNKEEEQQKINNIINKNIQVLNYLIENPDICEKSEFDIIKNMKYIDILKAYFISRNFEQSIEDLYKKENKIYIEEYVNKSLTYVNFFSSNDINKISHNIEEEEDEDIFD